MDLVLNCSLPLELMVMLCIELNLIVNFVFNELN